MKFNIKTSDKILLIIVLILINTFILIKIFSTRSEKILLDYAELKSTNLISSIINKSVSDTLTKNNYNDIIIDYKDKDGQIINLNFDNYKINNFMNNISNNIIESINLLEIKKAQSNLYYVPYGIIYNTPILSNLGPKIPFKIDYLGSVITDSKINVKEYGINSSIVEVIVNTKLQVEIILPFRSKKVEIEKNIILDSKIIQGQIPEYYGGLISGSLK